MAKFAPIFRYGVLVISALTIAGSVFYSQEVFAAKFTTPPGSTANTAWQNINSDVIISGNVGVGTTVAPTQPGITVTNGGALRFDSTTGLVSNSYSGSNLQMAVKPYQANGDYWQLSSNGGIILTDRTTSSAPRGYLYFDGSGFGLRSGDGAWRVRTFTGGQELSGTTYTNTIQSANYYDRDNNNYYLDPAGVSMVNQVQAASLYSSITGTWLPWPTNNWNYIRGATQAFNQPWYDETNGAYYIDPSNGSQFNNLNANALYDANRRVAVSNGYGQNYVDFSNYNVTNPLPGNSMLNITQTGFYQGYQPDGQPTGAHWGVIHMEYPDGTHNWYQQLAFNFYGDEVWLRRRAGGALGNWRKLALADDNVMFSSIAATGNLIFTPYMGGWYMQDTTWVRSYSNKWIYTGGVMRGDGGLQSSNVQVGTNAHGWGGNGNSGCLGCTDSVAGSPNLWLTSTGVVYVRGGYAPDQGHDFAELFKSKQHLSAGDIVTTSDQISTVQKSTLGNPNLLGVVSTKPALLIDGSGIVFGDKDSIDRSGFDKDPIEKQTVEKMDQDQKDKYAIALAGRVPVKVSNRGGEIKFGDSITSSDLTGIGVKASGLVNTVGKAMSEFTINRSNNTVNGYTCQNVSSIEEIQWPSLTENDDLDGMLRSCFKLPDGTYVGKVMMFVNTSTYDSDAYLVSTNEVRIDGQKVSSAGNVITKIQLMAEAVVGRLQAGIVETKQLIVNGVDVMQKLSEMQTKIDQQDQEIKQLKQAVQELQTNN